MKSKIILTKMKQFMRLIGPIVLCIIFFTVDWGKLLGALGSVDWGWLIFAWIAFVLAISMRGIRWYFVSRILGSSMNWIQAVSIHFFSIYVGAATPGRVGELIRAYALKKEGVSSQAAFVGAIWDRFQDVTFAAISALFAFLVFGSPQNYEYAFFASIGSSCGIVFVLPHIFLVLQRVIKNIRGFRINKIKKSWFFPMMCSMFAWLFQVLSYFLLSKGLHLNFNYFEVAFLTGLAVTAALMPISFFGIGTRDAVFILFFSKIGYSKESAVIYSTACLSMGVSVTMLASLFQFYPYIKNFKK